MNSEGWSRFELDVEGDLRFKADSPAPSWLTHLAQEFDIEERDNKTQLSVRDPLGFSASFVISAAEFWKTSENGEVNSGVLEAQSHEQGHFFELIAERQAGRARLVVVYLGCDYREVLKSHPRARASLKQMQQHEQRRSGQRPEPATP